MGFQQGISGLNAASKNLDVIGHNIANSGTVGFKASRAEFADLVANSMAGFNGGTGKAGFGVEVAAISQQFSQGGLNMTGNGLDVAINGGGFFKLQLPDGSAAYTRAGNFKQDKNGDVMTNDGARVMGYKVDPDTGIASSTTTPLSFPIGSPIPAKQTTSITAALNLDARANLAAGVAASPAVPADPSTTPPTPAKPAMVAVPPTPRSTYGTSVNAYDTQGVPLPVNVYFEKSGSNEWEVYDKLDDLNADPAVIGRFVGKMGMDGNGKMNSITQPTVWDADGNPTEGSKISQKSDGTFETTPITWTWTKVETTAVAPALPKTIGWTSVEAAGTAAAGPSSFDFNLALQVESNGANPNTPPLPFSVDLNLSKVTQFGSKFAVSDLKQDGYASGELKGINIAGDGTVVASYSNGLTRVEAQLALTNFRNPQGLTAVGGNNWVASGESGEPIDGKPGSGSFGTLRAGALEESNVDLTAELVNMMTAQRSYQANAQTIKTQDQVMSTLVNLR